MHLRIVPTFSLNFFPDEEEDEEAENANDACAADEDGVKRSWRRVRCSSIA